MFEKTCSKCSTKYETDTVDEMRKHFYRNKNLKDGYVTVCKNCRKEMDKVEYVIRNKKKYSDKNKDVNQQKAKERVKINKYVSKSIDRLLDTEIEEGIEILQQRIDDLKLEKFKRRVGR